MAKESKKAREAREAAELAAKNAGNAGPVRDLLAEAVAAFNTGSPLMATELEMGALLNDPRGPLVEYNKAMVQGDRIAFRATQLGIQAFAERSAGAPAQQPAAPAWGQPGPVATQPGPATNAQPVASAGPTNAAPVATAPKTFTFDANIPVPTPRRGGRGSTVYGFETMDIGHSFFIPVTVDNPNPAKRVASTVSSASDRLKPKKFVVRSVDETAAGRSKGARVWRTA